MSGSKTIKHEVFMFYVFMLYDMVLLSHVID